MARLLEFEAKDLLRKAGLPVPAGRVASTPEKAAEASEKIGFPVVLKAQVAVGKRGKAGGILFADNRDEALARAGELIGKSIYGFRTEQILIEKKIDIKDEHYLGVISNPATKTPTLIFARQGGMDVEEQAAKGAEGLVTLDINLLEGEIGRAHV